jgi:hypothetical protein
MGGGGMGPISVTPIGGSSRSVIMGCIPWAPVCDCDDDSWAAWDDDDDDDDEEDAGVCWTAMAMTGDRLDGCEPTVMVVDVVTVVTPEAAALAPDVVVEGDAVATEMMGSAAALPGNFDMTDGEPEPEKQKKKNIIRKIKREQ